MIAIGNQYEHEGDEQTMAKCSKSGKDKMDLLEAQLTLARIDAVGKHHRKQHDQNRPQRWYRCEFCHWYHLTGQEKRNKSQSN